MEELTNFDLLEITNLNSKEYLLTMNVNGEEKNFTVYIEMTKPIFGVNFSDDFIYLLRNYYADTKQLVSIVKNYYDGKKNDLPLSLLIEENIPELQAA
jgi:hypothetical protein